jgi:hypothetical protein
LGLVVFKNRADSSPGLIPSCEKHTSLIKREKTTTTKTNSKILLMAFTSLYMVKRLNLQRVAA